MHVHNYEKLWLLASLALIVGFISTIVYGAVGAGVVMVNDEGGQVNASGLSEHPEFNDPGVRKVGPNEYEAYVVAQQFAFSPDPIEVPANSTVTFYVTSRDVVHGFEVAGTNANAMVVPGEVSKMTVEFNETDEYGVVCNEYCGQAHHDMAGEVIVKEPGNFTLDDAGESTTAQATNGTDETANGTGES
ncbi:cytochrome c oxidase subunit II [Halorientalis salina]|uniref:cytochrome c oxidase subunit II n=1 Tax=Halorientalis salina TaxID=2932266 RepID=UPI0010ACD34E|nr:cytochrome c oxidase subunit II [Halorientalis salina]